MDKDKPETRTADVDAPAENDVVSDPGKGAGDRVDWADEGGATADGPATDPEDT